MVLYLLPRSQPGLPCLDAADFLTLDQPPSDESHPDVNDVAKTVQQQHHPTLRHAGVLVLAQHILQRNRGLHQVAYRLATGCGGQLPGVAQPLAVNSQGVQNLIGWFLTRGRTAFDNLRYSTRTSSTSGMPPAPPAEVGNDRDTAVASWRSKPVYRRLPSAASISARALSRSATSPSIKTSTASRPVSPKAVARSRRRSMSTSASRTGPSARPSQPSSARNPSTHLRSISGRAALSMVRIRRTATRIWCNSSGSAPTRVPGSCASRARSLKSNAARNWCTGGSDRRHRTGSPSLTSLLAVGARCGLDWWSWAAALTL